MPHRMYFEVHSTGFAGRAQSPDIADLHALYIDACTQGKIPELADFDVDHLGRFSPFLMRLEPAGHGSYRYGYYGSGIRDVAGFNMIGRSTADFEGPVRTFFEDVYKRSAETGDALFTIHRAIKAQLIHTWERLVLPVRMVNADTAFIVYNRPREFEQDFLQSIMHALPDGIVALRGLRDDDGHLINGSIVSANPAACKLLGTTAEQLHDGMLRSAMPSILTSDVWDVVKNVIHHREQNVVEIAHDHGGFTRHLRLQITALFDGALLHISDITALKLANHVLSREQEQLRIEISRHRSEGDVLRGMAHTDQLTGVLNRRGLFSGMDEREPAHGAWCILAVDIDRFKAVNDRYGHGVGDDAIRCVAAVLKAITEQAGGCVGRLGGDEFVCVLPVSLAQAVRLANEARIGVAVRPVSSSVGPVMFTCSFGVSEWHPGQSFDMALQQADAALYAAKSEGRDRVEYSSDSAGNRKASVS